MKGDKIENVWFEIELFNLKICWLVIWLVIKSREIVIVRWIVYLKFRRGELG